MQPDIRRILTQVQNQLKILYGSSSYYTTAYAKEEQGYWGKIPEWIQSIRGGQFDTTPVVDIGPGYGTLLGFCSYLGYKNLLGLDRRFYINHEVMAEYNIRMTSFDVERDQSLSQIGAPGLVIMTEVLEHFNFHPLPTLRRIRRQMAACSALVLSTPDAESWGRIPGYNQLSDIPPFDPKTQSWDNPPWKDQHVWQYTWNELDVVLNKAGFDVLDRGESVSSGGKHMQVLAVPANKP